MCNLEIIGACLCTDCFIFSQNITCLLCLNTENNVHLGFYSVCPQGLSQS